MDNEPDCLSVVGCIAEWASAAIAKLTHRHAVEKVLFLNLVRANPSLALEPYYQRLFKGYYRMGKRDSAFYQHYFALLEEAASQKSLPSLEDLLSGLYRATGQRHLSFSSKLLATVDDSAVIYDRNVASLLKVPSTQLPHRNWLAEAKNRYAAVERGITAFTRRTEWPEIEAIFDTSFPDATDLPILRKADLLLWVSYEQLHAKNHSGDTG
jgi:hypothetical protein